MKRSNKVAFIVIGAGMAAVALMVVLLPFITKRSGLCAYTSMIDNKFGDQHLKTVVALLELYRARHDRYPDRLSDLDFVGDWDRIALNVTAYHPNDTRTRYHVEVTRGWLCSPNLSYPPEFWNGTGYDASLKP
jgi:hypothetical protein